MINVIAQSIAVPLIFVGIFFFIIGTVGLLRFPDIYCRVHATSKCDTLGAGAILLALAIYEHKFFISLKLMVICALVFVHGPTIAHVISRTAYRKGLTLWKKQPDIFYAEKEKE